MHLNKNEKHNYFEGLRGILALIVFAHHFILLFYSSVYYGSLHFSDYINNPYSSNLLLANTPLNLFMNGNWAVCMFFTLSGYVLTIKYFKTSKQDVLRNSALKRYFRLAIPIFGSALLIFVLHKVGLFKDVSYPRTHSDFQFGKDLFTTDLDLPSFLKTTFISIPLNGNNIYAPVYWTMQHEFLGAIFILALLLVIHKVEKKNLVLILLIVVLLIAKKYYLTAFLFGCFLSFNASLISIIKYKKTLLLFSLLLGTYLIGIPNIEEKALAKTIYSPFAGYPNEIVILFHVLSSALILLFISQTNFIQKALSVKPLVWLGKISFSLYLIHLPLIFIIGSYFLSSTHGSLNPYLLFIVLLIVTTSSSFFFYLMFDKNAINFSNKLISLLEKKEN
ncbi:MAG: acyltransferase family protein [Bacteroidia bacterium]